MKPLKRSPHYLVQNPHSYCFRAYVPKDLQPLVGKKELRYSLKTGTLVLPDPKLKSWQLRCTGYFITFGMVDGN